MSGSLILYPLPTLLALLLTLLVGPIVALRVAARGPRSSEAAPKRMDAFREQPHTNSPLNELDSSPADLGRTQLTVVRAASNSMVPF